MKIFIKTPIGKTITITIEPALTVLDVKQKIQECEGFPCDQQRLNFAGTQLLDAQTLTTCGIGEESTIQLALHMGKNFEVTVRSSGDKTIAIRVDSEYLVLFLKIRIHEQEGIPIEQQMLVLNGKCLDDNRRMIEYNIDTESAIRLMVRENPFQCPVCKEDFQAQGDLAPHGLLCGHSFCHRDLRALVEEEKVSCPVCVVATDLNLCVGGFPARNVVLVESLDRSQIQWGVGIVDSVPMCGECDADANQRQATVFCTACAVDLCDGCDAQLHARSLRLHQRTPISSRLPPAAKCSVHGDAMRRYCIDCQTSVCANCVLTEGSHHGHNHRLESAVVSERKKKIKDQTAHCFENLCDLQALLAGLCGVDSGLERNQATCLAALRAEKDVAIAAIDARWDVIEQAVRAEVQTRRCNVKVQREAAEGAMWRADACKREALAAVAAAG